MEKFYGINPGSHDSSFSAVTVDNGDIVDIEVLLSERFTLVKRQGAFPVSGMKKYFFQEKQKNSLASINNENLSANSYGGGVKEYQDKVLSPKSKKVIKLLGFDRFLPDYNKKLYEPTHHLSHAYSLLAQYPFEESLIVIADGVGSRVSEFESSHPERSYLPDGDNKIEGEMVTVYHQKGNNLRCVKKYWVEDSYEECIKKKALTFNLFNYIYMRTAQNIFGEWTKSGKVMGLSAYGGGSHEQRFLVELEESRDSLPSRNSKDKFDSMSLDEFQSLANLCAVTQKNFETKVLSLIGNLKKEFPNIRNLSLAGGFALNCITNSKVFETRLFKHVYVPPYPCDTGISLGTIIANLCDKKKLKFKLVPIKDQNAYLGCKSTVTQESELALFKDYNIVTDQDLSGAVAVLTSGEPLAFYYGRSEVGPRALGNRSIFASPNLEGITEKLNKEIKFREAFRPYGISILKEKQSDYFEGEFCDSPFMSFAPLVKAEAKRSFRHIHHPNERIRVQSVVKNSESLTYELIKAFDQKERIPFLINTSLNTMGMPIVETVEDLFMFFKKSNIKYLYLKGYLISK